MKMKKAQLISFDLGASVAIFLIFLVVFIGIFMTFQGMKTTAKFEFELSYVYDNLENNLKQNGDTAFFSNYRVDAEKWAAFVSALPPPASDPNAFDAYVLGNISNAHGIGMSEDGFDTCLYLSNENGPITLGIITAIGSLKAGKTCNEVITDGKNPCDTYKQALSMFKPVALITDKNTGNNEIVSMNLVLCRK